MSAAETTVLPLPVRLYNAVEPLLPTWVSTAALHAMFWVLIGANLLCAYVLGQILLSEG